uniref:RING-type domain-containing protein n=1 Tax=Physcomitrium patens TaxID=3218 RepID=A0A2K1J9Y1_PHYPA|nr:hypothetical protein PHYPA_021449 [Physcomitrium patens]
MSPQQVWKEFRELKAALEMEKTQALADEMFQQESLESLKKKLCDSEMEVVTLEDQVHSLTADVEKLKEAQASLERGKDCAVCFEELEGFLTVHSGETTSQKRPRACFVPCMHAKVCTSYAEEIWNNCKHRKKCPICEETLRRKPRRLHP